MDHIKTGWRTALVCALLTAVTVAAYWPVLHYGFINCDDPQYITQNPHVLAGWTWPNIKWAFTTGDAANWHPVTWLSHILDVQLFGLKPGWHHLVNLLFHTANAVLLLLLLRRTTGALWRSAFVAALFALHPLHVESVAWAAERKDVLSTFFFMLTLLAYAKYAGRLKSGPGNSAFRIPHSALDGSALRTPQSALESPSTLNPQLLAAPKSDGGGWYALSLVLFALGLMSKPMLVTLPCVLLLLDFWPLGRLRLSTLNSQPSTPVQGSKLDVRRSMFARLLVEKLPFFALSAASCIVTLLVQQSGGAVSSSQGLPFGLRAANAISSYLKYLGKAIWPIDLAVFYPFPGGGESPGDEWEDWQVLAAVLVLVAISALAVMRLKRQPWFAVGWFWYLGTMVPVIGFVQVGMQAMADRYTYIPLIGIFISTIWTCAELSAACPALRNPGSAAAVVALTFCALGSRRQVRYWCDSLALFGHALEVAPNNGPARFNLGTAFSSQGKYGLAVSQLKAAQQAEPFFADAHYNLGFVFARMGRLEKAAEQYRATLAINPTHIMARNSLGAVLWQLGRHEEALAQYEEALRINPDYADAHYNQGLAFGEQGKLAEAESDFAETVRLKPNHVEALWSLGALLAKEGKLDEACARFQDLERLCPTNAEPHLSLAAVYRKLGRPDAALSEYSEGLRLDPVYPGLHFIIGSIALERGDGGRAESELAAALAQKPNDLDALRGLGRALAVQGKLSQAAAKFTEVVRLSPMNPEAYLALGGALMLAGRTNEAATNFSAALALDPGLAAKALQDGKALAEKGSMAEALGRFTTALWLKPDDAEAQQNLGLLLARQGKLEEAVRHFQEAIRLRPDAESYRSLGLARLLQGRAKEAVALYQQALQLKPDWPDGLNDLAWVLATSPQAAIRDGPEAVRLAERACQVSGGKEARLWGTLDAAYAEAGRFDDAITTAEKARTLALGAGENDIAEAAEKRLALYRNRQPFHQ